MAAHGYDAVYVQRPSMNVSGWSGRFKFDGCALFFRRATLKLELTQVLKYDDIHDRVALMVRTLVFICMPYSPTLLYTRRT